MLNSQAIKFVNISENEVLTSNGELTALKTFFFQDLNTRLKKLINAADVMLFMKGVPAEPKCGKHLLKKFLKLGRLKLLL